LYYYRARYYDPGRGRFISEDPLGFAAGDVNFYAYVGNNPVNANDPSGMIDITYSAGSLKPIITNINSPGRNYFVAGSDGATYPMGTGVYQRTVVQGRPFDNVIGAIQTAKIVDWGVSHIQNNRLSGASGDASLSEVNRQSGEGRVWDTKQFLSPTSVYAINGKVELRDYVGNAIWGAGLRSLGISELVARIGAQVQSIRANGSLDDPRDQQAIHFGYNFPSSSNGGGGLGTDAADGFLLYPNKPNTNQMQSVYSK
ncbi:RHS repeat-associated core domain-containing protein, partial [Thauera sinica]